VCQEMVSGQIGLLWDEPEEELENLEFGCRNNRKTRKSNDSYTPNYYGDAQDLSMAG